MIRYVANLLLFQLFFFSVEAQVQIGASNYSTLQAAFTDINNGVKTGAITILITSNTNETGVAVLNASGTGSSSYSSVTITPQSSVLTISSGSNPAINLNGADNVTFNGDISGARGLRIRQTGNNVTIQLTNDASRNTIKNCILESNSNSANGTVFIGTGTTTGNDRIAIDNCELRNRSDVAIAGGTGTTATTNVPRTAIRIAGTSSTVSNDTIIISNSQIYNFFVSSTGSPTTVDISSNTSDVQFKYNHIYQTANFFGASSFTTYLTLINIGNTSINKIYIRKNYIGGRATFCSGGAFVVSNPNTSQRCRLRAISSSVAGTNTITIDSNTITNIQMDFRLNTCGGQDAFTGILCNGSGVADVSHNTIGTSMGTGAINLSQQVNNTSACLVSVSGIEISGSSATLNNNTVGGFTFTYGLASTYGFSFTGLRVNNSASNTFTIYDNLVGSSSFANNIFFNTNSSINQIRGIYNVSPNNTVNIYNNLVSNINDNTSSASSYVVGLEQAGTGTANIYSNQIQNISSSSVLPYTTLINTAVSGIFLSGNGISNIYNNVIHSISSTATGTTLGSCASGLYINSTSTNSHRVYNNRIYDIRNSSQGTSPFAVGIALRNFSSNSRFYHNMISLGLNTDGSSNGAEAIYAGLWNGTDNPGSNLNFYFNSVSIGGTAGSGTYNTYGFLRGDNDGNTATLVTTPVQIYNNIFNNARSGAGNHFALGNQETPLGWAQGAPCGPGLSPDYNALLSSSLTTVGEWLGVSHDFVNWQSNSMGDANSVHLGTSSVVFTDKTIADLHVPNSEIRVNSKGLPLSFITTDIDGNFRRGVDIGADEVQNIITSNGFGDDWHNAANWTPAQVPGCADEVIIPSGADKRINNTSGQNGYFYTLTITNGSSLILEDNTELEGCWLNDGVNHLGQFLNEGTFISNDAVVRIAGLFTNNNDFQRGVGLVEMNMDTPSGLSNCVSSIISGYNSVSPISNLAGTSNTNFYNLSIINSGNTTIQFGMDVTVGEGVTDAGLLNISNGGWLAINGNALKIEGDLANTTGQLTGSPTSDLVINGTGLLSGSINFTNNASPDNELENLVINRISGTINLGSNDVIVNTLLDLSNGIFITPGNFEVNVTNNLPSSVQNHNSGSFIDGHIRRAVSGTQIYDFPVGDGIRYELATMEITSSLGVNNIRGYFNPSDATDPNGNLPLNDSGNLYDVLCAGGFWELVPDLAASGIYNLTLNGLGFTCGGPHTIAGQDASNDWQFGGSTFISMDNRNDFNNSAVNLTQFTLVSSSTLPIELVKLEAVCYESEVTIHWITAMEKNNAYFEIQHSVDGINFRNIGIVKGMGNSGTSAKYSYVAPKSVSGNSYYRLKQNDFDGIYTYSHVIFANCESSTDILVYPNPNNGDFKVFVPLGLDTKENYHISIQDVQGREVIQNFNYYLDPAGSTIEFNWKNKGSLPSGIYVFRLHMEGNQYKSPLIIVPR